MTQEEFESRFINKILCGDCLDVMKDWPLCDLLCPYFILDSHVALVAKRYQIFELVCSIVIIIKLAIWPYVMHVQLLFQFLFRFVATLARMIISFSCKSSLLIPIRPAITVVSAIPHSIIFARYRLDKTGLRTNRRGRSNKMRQAGFKKGHHYFTSSGVLDIEKEDIERIVPNYDYGHAFAYLWRRFGPPVNGWDNYKDLVLYVLTTRRKDVYLTCDCKPWSYLTFGIGISDALCKKSREWQFEARKDDILNRDSWPDFMKEIIKALLDAIEELKRPVPVRDMYFTIEGLMNDRAKNPVKASTKAGYGITNAYFKRFKE